ncbi:MAG: hypothetical protein M3179_12895, partial [Actinomycetota bacterium]|nr:hypothetical protein [Actinomycetota bacterium]
MAEHRRPLGVRAGSRRFVAVAVGVVSALLLPLSVEPAGAVTFSNPAAITPQFLAGVAPAVPYPSVIGVSALSGTVTDVEVTLCGLSATFPEDVDLLLAGPGDTPNALIMSDVGGDNTDPPIRPVSSITVTLSDQAPSALPADTQLTSGT